MCKVRGDVYACGDNVGASSASPMIKEMLIKAFPGRICLSLEIMLRNYVKKEGEAVVELDEFKAILNSYTKPLVEVRDSL